MPETTLPIKLTPLIEADYAITPFTVFGDTPFGRRMLVATTGGTFEGERLRGEIVPGGTDWVTMGADGSLALELDLSLRTDDDALIHFRGLGRLVAPPAILGVLTDPVKRGELNPDDYYWRTSARFATGAEKYKWINNIVAVASTRFTIKGLHYSFASVD